MNTLIIDNAMLSATKLKYLLRSRELEATIISSEKIAFIKETIIKEKFQNIGYIFVSMYLGNELSEFINNFVSKLFPQAHIILIFVKDNVVGLPPTSILNYDGVIGQPFLKKDLDNLLLRLETG